ncbi:MAG: hypothetical protein JW843_11780 [Candidatus Aminicenantes bacterium]|nr:hypothetical protein [Candidatus Aminicenantes bacterium]
MSYKKILKVGAAMLLGFGLIAADSFAQTAQNGAGDQLRTRSQIRLQFLDEDCDGINDNFRDHDNDGIPNGQDPDWTAPKDGTGFKQQRNGQNKASFRGQGGGLMNMSGAGVCDGTGPQGQGKRRGGR